jgi:hypothetical protein
MIQDMASTNLLTLFDREMRQELVIPDMRKDLFPWGVRFVRPAPGMSFIQYSKLAYDELDRTIDEQISYFRALQQRFTWKIYAHDRAEVLQERLLARGFIPDEPAAVMALDLEQAASMLLAPIQLDVRPIVQRDQLKDIIRVLEAVWGGDFGWVSERLGAHLEIPGYLSAFTAYLQDRPVSVAWVYFPPGSQFASLWGGSTLVEQRGKGWYSALLARRVQEAIHRGRRYAFIETGPESQPIVARRGFTQLTAEQDFEWQPPKTMRP